MTSRYSFPSNDTDPLHISPARTINERYPPKPGNGVQLLLLSLPPPPPPPFYCPFQPPHPTAYLNPSFCLSVQPLLLSFPPLFQCGGGTLNPFYLCVNKCVKATLHLFFFFLTGVCYKLNYIALQSALHAVSQLRYEISSLWTYLWRCCVFASLTRAGHGAWVSLSAVETLFAGALHGLFLRRRAVRRTLGAVGIRGRRFVGSGSAR